MFTFRTIIKSLIKTVKKAIYAIKNRQQFKASKEVIDKRLYICFGTKDCMYTDKCDSLIENSKFIFWKQKRCGLCGCYIKAKVKFAFEECPLKKW